MADNRSVTKPGIYPAMAAAEYYADPCPAPSLTQSVAKVLLAFSPAHARLEHPRLAGKLVVEEGYEKVKAIGTVAHKLMLGRGKEVIVVDARDFMKGDAKGQRDAAHAAGKVPILAKHNAVAEAMVKAARAQLDATGFPNAFVQGYPEVALVWQHDGLWMRSLVDWLTSTTEIWDYKTTGLCCAPHVVAERPSEQGWDIQGAMIERGLDALDPGNAGRRTIRFVAQENFAPYALTVVRLSAADLTLGRKKLAMATDVWGACLRAGAWPLYPAEEVVSQPKPWLERQFLERELAEDDRHRSRAVPFDPHVLLAG